MRREMTISMLVAAMAVPAMAANFKGTTTLKDVQTTGTIDKEHKHQQYNLMFVGKGNSYTCQTNANDSMNATDFVVGSQMKYEVDGKNGKLINSDGKSVKCKIVRVEMLPTTP
jgi:gentisate 1,2-dioxygenase